MGRCGSVGKKYGNLHYIIGNKLFFSAFGRLQHTWSLFKSYLQIPCAFPVAVQLEMFPVSILEICDNFIHETDF